MQRKEFKNAKVFKRQSFQYFNDLALIVGNDVAEGGNTATTQETEEEINVDYTVDLDDYYEDVHTPVRATTDLDEE